MSIALTKDQLGEVMERVFEECRSLRGAGQKEYAGGANAFGNFVRLAEELDSSPEKVLWIYAMKHKDGVAAYIRGHESQREPVDGRINDLITYLCILRGMVEARRFTRPGVPDWEDLGLDPSDAPLSPVQRPSVEKP